MWTSSSKGDGIRFAQEFAKQHKVRVRSHRKFGTAVLVFEGGFKVDVATARMEYYESPAAPPTVETSSLKLDLYRRDFTINTLAVKLNKRHYGTMIDYFGAQADIKEKVLRVLHNLSFVEDPTRVLRAVRFEQRFGFKIGTLTLALIKNAVKINCFKDLSPRRLFLELKLILKEEDPVKAIERMNELDVLGVIAPEIAYSERSVPCSRKPRGSSPGTTSCTWKGDLKPGRSTGTASHPPWTRPACHSWPAAWECWTAKTGG